MLFLLSLACVSAQGTAVLPDGSGGPDDTGSDDTGSDSTGSDDTGDTNTDTGVAATPKAWNFLVYMDGDNDLEEYVINDLNELETTGTTPNLNVLVLADRGPGYDESDGDWQGSRIYRIIGDDDRETLSSEVVEDLGEVNMADPATLDMFLHYASTNYPAERTAFVFWDHGSGWDVAPAEAAAPDEAVAPPAIIQDDSSGGDMMSIAGGEVAEGLAPWVLANGKLDLVGFDACNMANWEVAFVLAPYAETMTGAQTWVGGEGYRYEPVLRQLAVEPDTTAPELADLMARTPVEGGEYAHSAIDLSQIDPLSDAIDALALGLMDDGQGVWDARDGMMGGDSVWTYYYLDVGSLATTVPAVRPDLQSLADEVDAALRNSVIATYSQQMYEGLSGLNIFFDPRDSDWTEAYATGAWSEATHWDDYLATLRTE